MLLVGEGAERGHRNTVSAPSARLFLALCDLAGRSRAVALDLSVPMTEARQLTATIRHLWPLVPGARFGLSDCACFVPRPVVSKIPDDATVTSRPSSSPQLSACGVPFLSFDYDKVWVLVIRQLTDHSAHDCSLPQCWAPLAVAGPLPNTLSKILCPVICCLPHDGGPNSHGSAKLGSAHCAPMVLLVRHIRLLSRSSPATPRGCPLASRAVRQASPAGAVYRP